MPIINCAAQAVGSLLLTACSSAEPKAVPSSLQAIQQEIKASDMPLTLVHIWATWCGPCQEEFPELIKAYKRFHRQGLKLMLISADDPVKIDRVDIFLREQNCPVDSLIAEELNQSFIEALSSNWTGALPASFFYVDGQLVEEWEGKRSFEQYTKIIEHFLTKVNIRSIL